MGRRYDSVEAMVHATMDKEFATRFSEQVRRRYFVKRLVGLRMARSLSQADMTKHLGCTQGRVSKLENSNDDDLRLGNLRRYADALDMDVQIVLARKKLRLTDKIKLHALAIKNLLEKLVGLAHLGDEFARAIAQFHGEAFFNLVRIVKQSADELPRDPSSDDPRIQIDVLELPPDEFSEEASTTSPSELCPV